MTTQAAVAGDLLDRVRNQAERMAAQNDGLQKGYADLGWDILEVAEESSESGSSASRIGFPDEVTSGDEIEAVAPAAKAAPQSRSTTPTLRPTSPSWFPAPATASLKAGSPLRTPAISINRCKAPAQERTR